MITKAVGGEFYDLAGAKTELAFCPLKDIDGDADLQWAVGWIEVLCELNGLKLGPRHRNAVSEAVLRLRLPRADPAVCTVPRPETAPTLFAPAV